MSLISLSFRTASEMVQLTLGGRLWIHTHCISYCTLPRRNEHWPATGLAHQTHGTGCTFISEMIYAMLADTLLFFFFPICSVQTKGVLRNTLYTHQYPSARMWQALWAQPNVRTHLKLNHLTAESGRISSGCFWRAKKQLALERRQFYQSPATRWYEKKKPGHTLS